MGNHISNSQTSKVNDYALIEDQAHQIKAQEAMIKYFIKVINTKFAKLINNDFENKLNYVEYRYNCTKSNSCFKPEMAVAVGTICTHLADKYPAFYFRVTMDCIIRHGSRTYTLCIKWTKKNDFQTI